jgi:hypothetical protein
MERMRSHTITVIGEEACEVFATFTWERDGDDQKKQGGYHIHTAIYFSF